jgi:ABC-type transporter Mla subunit MlaD
MQRKSLDVWVGLFVLLGFAAIVFLVTQITNREFSLRSESYRLQAQFENVGGLKPGETKSIKGKIYILPNDVPALLTRYAKDFPTQPEK